MKKGICVIFSFVLLTDFSFTQNLVLNNEFEDTTFCPTSLDQLNAATGWRSYAGTADYYNTCSFSIFSKVPKNYFGFQQPSSGKAYAGIIAIYTANPNYREFAGSMLATPLVAGTKYFISFKVALANSYDYNRTCNNLGMKFTNWDYWYSSPAPVNNSAHVFSSAVISDTANWTRISGSFVADSNYARVMIGNFFKDTSTISTGDPAQHMAYFYLDDICVSTDSAFCKNYMGVEEEINSNQVSVYPNPFSDQVTFMLNEEAGNSALIVYNVLGVKVRCQYFSGKQVMLYRENLEPGIYFYRILSDGNSFISGKLIAN